MLYFRKWLALIVCFHLTVCLMEASAGSGEDCQRILRNVSSKGLLTLPKDPVESLKEKHWTAFKSPAGLMEPSVLTDLETSFDRIFTDHGKDPYAARVLLGGLKSYKPSSSVNIANVNESSAKLIDEWAKQTLGVAREATGEDLIIANISLGRGHRVGNDEGTLIHADNQGTYLHALVTLKGPTTVAFPENPELGDHRLISVDPQTGQMKVRKIDRHAEEPPQPFMIESGGQTKLGETIMFGGGDYLVKPGRVAIQHASPPSSDLNRLTLFISFKPKE